MPEDTNEVQKAIAELQTSQPEAGAEPAAAPVTNYRPEPPAPVPTPKASRKKLIIAVAAIVVLAGGTLGAFALKKDKPAAKAPAANTADTKSLGVAVGLVDGSAEYSKDAATWSKLTEAADLAEGDRVRTAAGSRLVLLIDDGSAVRLDANSEIKLTDLAPDNIVITNVSGDVYSRVVASESRTYKVAVNAAEYTAKGTAYRTINKADKQGVEVFQSKVEYSGNKTSVAEGNGFYTKANEDSKENSVIALDLEALKKDAFIKWNKDQDKKVEAFASNLGILGELDKPAPKEDEDEKDLPAATADGITLKGKQSGYSAVFTWTVKNVDTSKGFKLVKSKDNAKPSYPDNSAAFIDAGKSTYTLYVGDGKTYYYRLCAYREGSCVSYSNTVTVKTDAKPKAVVESGTVSLTLGSSTLEWEITGTAPYGYKVVIGTTSGPTYENHYKKIGTTAKEYDLSNVDLTDGTTYYVKVCKYKSDGGCQDYSNEIQYTP